METWRAIMTQGVYNAEASASKASRYGVLDDDADKLAQPLISRRGSDDVPPYDYSHYGYPVFQDEVDHDENALERGGDERDGLLWKHRPSRYEEIPLKPSPTTVLRAIVAQVLWPMTAVGAQTAKVFTSSRRPVPTRDTAVDVEDRHALHTVTTLRAPTAKSRRRAETLDEIHDRALMRIALATLVFSTWLIITVYCHAD